ncbi:pilus assembly PilX family protein [Elongatibacter sediminis]|uniref:PilX N-terminal domain-containing pilus assembly protein n=1 Tax=Elongatibacter sediminis TaxID=3119006 RepID=A0AAW9RA35_9GAMM
MQATAQWQPIRHQRGVLTVFTGVFILVMLTLMMMFAVRAGVAEQRTSSNEVRQKLALHAAETGIQHAKEYFIANSALIASDLIDKLPDGTDGWLAAGATRWLPCADVDLSAGHGSHPCFAEPDLDRRAETYYYSRNGSTEVSLGTDTVLSGTGQEVTVYALLCKLMVSDFASPPVQGCSRDPNIADEYHYMITILARGRADCSDGTCGAEALVAEPLANYGVLSGGNGPGVPLTTRTSWAPSGTAEIIPNPNGGGVGVPVSVWLNNNPNCPNQAVVDPSSGSWSTCELHEWYETEQVPENLECPGSCSCSVSESISYTHGNSDVIGIDMDLDTEFPCDLFTFYFGIPKTHYEAIKSQAQIIDDCSELGPNSYGVYWATGPLCHIGSNTVIGSQHAPVMLISAASTIRFNGGTKMFGTLYVTDVEDAAASIEGTGNNTFYGAVIVDAAIDKFSGTFQVVYVETVARITAGTGGIGTLAGGWTDFHRDWE